MLRLLIKKVAFNYTLNTALLELLSEGFISYKGCHFLKSLNKHQSHINESDFTDHIGHECFINSIHFDDYVENDVFEQALLFSDSLIKDWNAQNNGLVLILILSQTDFGFNLKFHLHREGENWINENDINKFEEALVVFNSYC